MLTTKKNKEQRWLPAWHTSMGGGGGNQDPSVPAPEALQGRRGEDNGATLTASSHPRGYSSTSSLWPGGASSPLVVHAPPLQEESTASH